MANDFYIRKEYLEAQDNSREALSAKSRKSLSETKSVHTIDAYESDWNDFCDWCRYNKQSAFPATATTIVNYINDLADNARISTIRRRISAISENYNAAHAGGVSYSNPCREWIVKEALVGLSRHKVGAQQGKTPIYWEEIQKMVNTMDLTTLSGLRDRAILLLGFMGAFRRSEISGLDVENLSFFPQGMVVTIAHSKTDQSSEGQQVGIPYTGDSDLCPIQAVRAWMSAVGIKDGPLFRSLTRSGTASTRRLSDKSINLIIKKYVRAIGLDPDLYGAHSLRHGFATSAALKGVEERIIMKQTRHRSVEMVRHYINEADLFVNNPISLMFNAPKK